MANSEDKDLLNNFLDDNLSPDEILLFKKKFNNDPAFAREVKQYTDMKLALRAASKVRVKAGLQTGRPAGVSINLSARFWAIAASLALLIGIAAYQLLKPQASGQFKELYAMHYASPFGEDEVLTRSGTENIDPDLLADFLQAIQLMESGKFAKADELLSTLDARPENPLTNEIEWYHALCTLRLGNKKLALDMFAYIQSSNSMYSEQARSIYTELTNN